ncbi:MAG: tRNA glutamyl-Q(34) synthetase GluQRS [Actinomycetota bacterium]
MTVGRFAPSPTGRLHLGNLRTGLVAWLGVRSSPRRASRFLLRYEDLDSAAVRDEHYRTQLDDVAAIGLEWDESPLRQSDRLPHYEAALAALTAADVIYPCYCSRREIREAAQAPNAPHAGHQYPGTCRDLSSAARSERARTRYPAFRVRADGASRAFTDLVAGEVEFEIDDFVVRRNDGTPAYHLAVVVDDHAQGVTQVVRADDLLESTSRHLLLYELLDLDPPDHAHVPLVLAPNGDRLAKRHGAVNLDDRAAKGESAAEVLRFLASTLGLCASDETVAGRPIGPAELVDRFRFDAIPRKPLTLPEDFLVPAGSERESDRSADR